MHLLVIFLAAALAIVLGLLVWSLNRVKPEGPPAIPTDPVLNAIPAGSAAAEPRTGKQDDPTEVRPSLRLPSLLEEPQDQLVLANEAAVLKVRAEGERVSYQWQRNGEDIPGAIDPFLLVTDIDLELDGGRYAVCATNEVGSIRSREATIRVQATSLIAGNPENPSIQISRWSDHHQLGPEVSSNEQLKVLLGNLLEKAPGLAVATQMAAGQSLYVIRLSSEMAQALASGTAHSMLEKGSEAIRSNIVRGSRTVGHASFLDVSKRAQVAGVALAVWQVMAIITAQKFLADINRRLAGIEHAIQDLKGWMEEAAFSALTSNHRYLCQVASALGTQSLNMQEATTFLNQIEHIDRECAKFQGLFQQRSLAALEDFRTQDVQGVGLKENTQELQKHGLQYLRMHSGHLNALQVRCAAAQVRLALPATPELVEARLAEIREVLTESQAMLRIFSEISMDQLRRVKGRFSKDKTDEAQRELVEQALNPTLANLRNSSEAIDSGLRDLELAAADILARYRHGIGLAVELGPSGEVLRVNQLAR